MNSPLVYSIPEACARAHTGRTALYEAIKSGALVARKRGKRTLVLHDDLCRYLQSLPQFAVNSAVETRKDCVTRAKPSAGERSSD